MMYVVLHNDFILEIAQIGRDLHEKKLLGVISFCVNNSIAVDRIRILRSNKVYFLIIILVLIVLLAILLRK